MSLCMASQEPMRRFLTRTFGCPQIASDLLQDLYLRLDRVPAVSDAAEARAWLFRVAINRRGTMTFAERRGCILLTGDRHLRTISAGKGIDVHGLLCVVDLLIEHEVVAARVSMDALITRGDQNFTALHISISRFDVLA